MRDSPEQAAYDTICSCAEQDCTCGASSHRTPYPYEDVIEVEDSVIQVKDSVIQVDCPCRDAGIQERMRRVIERFLTGLFRSKKRLKRIFRKKMACAKHISRIRVRIVLLCNPNLHVD